MIEREFPKIGRVGQTPDGEVDSIGAAFNVSDVGSQSQPDTASTTVQFSGLGSRSWEIQMQRDPRGLVFDTNSRLSPSVPHSTVSEQDISVRNAINENMIQLYERAFAQILPEVSNKHQGLITST